MGTLTSLESDDSQRLLAASGGVLAAAACGRQGGWVRGWRAGRRGVGVHPGGARRAYLRDEVKPLERLFPGVEEGSDALDDQVLCRDARGPGGRARRADFPLPRAGPVAAAAAADRAVGAGAAAQAVGVLGCGEEVVRVPW